VLDSTLAFLYKARRVDTVFCIDTVVDVPFRRRFALAEQQCVLGFNSNSSHRPETRPLFDELRPFFFVVGLLPVVSVGKSSVSRDVDTLLAVCASTTFRAPVHRYTRVHFTTQLWANDRFDVTKRKVTL